MMILRLWARFSSVGCYLAMALMMGMVAGQPAAAQSAWETMHPDSFSRSTAVARQQCDRTAGQSASDALTRQKCEQFELMLASGQCQQGAVPDGTIFNYMNYHHAGQSPSVQGSTVKRLGSNATQAAICNLGDGVVAYWFNEPGVGCNNVAFQLPRQTTAVAPPAPAPRQPVCRMVWVDQGIVHQSAPRTWHVPGFHTDHSDCGPHIQLPGVSGTTQSTIRSSIQVEVCE